MEENFVTRYICYSKLCGIWISWMNQMMILFCHYPFWSQCAVTVKELPWRRQLKLGKYILWLDSINIWIITSLCVCVCVHIRSKVIKCFWINNDKNSLQILIFSQNLEKWVRLETFQHPLAYIKFSSEKVWCKFCEQCLVRQSDLCVEIVSL